MGRSKNPGLMPTWAASPGSGDTPAAQFGFLFSNCPERILHSPIKKEEGVPLNFYISSKNETGSISENSLAFFQYLCSTLITAKPP